MKPIEFHEQNITIAPPYGEEDEIQPLPAVVAKYPNGHTAFISCWQLNWRELLRLLFTRRIYLLVLTVQQPPVLLTAYREELGIDEAELSQPNRGRLNGRA